MRALGRLLIASYLLAGCAGNSVVIQPGSLPLVPMDARSEARQEVLWVSGARDARPAERVGSKIGTVYTRFQKNPMPAYLDRNPDVYIKEQLGRFLFNRRLEATSAGAAKAFAFVELEDFSMSQEPGSVWSDFKVHVAYTVRFTDRDGRELGAVRLERSSEAASPLNPQVQLEEAFRSALADSFEALSRSSVFKTVLEGLRG